MCFERERGGKRQGRHDREEGTSTAQIAHSPPPTPLLPQLRKPWSRIPIPPVAERNVPAQPVARSLVDGMVMTGVLRKGNRRKRLLVHSAACQTPETTFLSFSLSVMCLDDCLLPICLVYLPTYLQPTWQSRHS